MARASEVLVLGSSVQLQLDIFWVHIPMGIMVDTTVDIMEDIMAVIPACMGSLVTKVTGRATLAITATEL